MGVILNENNVVKAEELVNNLVNTKDTSNVKRIKRERGLIERTNADNNKVILVEDNRQIICG